MISSIQTKKPNHLLGNLSMSYKIFLITLLSSLFISPLNFLQAFTPPQSYKEFSSYQNLLTHKELSYKIKTYLEKNAEIRNYFKLTDKAFHLYSSLENKEAHNPEYTLLLGTDENATQSQKPFKLKDGLLPLKGLKVAIDPGHLGGKMAKIEARYIDMIPHIETDFRQDIQFNEGTLNLLVSLRIKELLENKGAKVLLTRQEIGVPVYHKPYEDWLIEDFKSDARKKVSNIQDPEKREAAYQWWINEAPESLIFRRLYNPHDLRARVQKMNDFSPHLSFIVHFNAGAGNNKVTGQNLGTLDNKNMAFIPGSFMKGELRKKEYRISFLRLLVTQDLSHSHELASNIMKNFINDLKVSANTTSYNTSLHHDQTPGVYSRNLTMLTYLKGPVFYGESLYQDNYEESQRLLADYFLLAPKFVDGTLEAKDYQKTRLEKVAQSYFKGLMKFLK